MSSTYRILDEPTGHNVGKFVIQPFWPLLALMFAGAWLAALLFALNAWFLRGPTWRRELVLVAATLLGSVAILLVISFAGNSGFLPRVAVKYALLLVVVWKLSLMYWIFFSQQSAYALREYFSRGSKTNQPLPLGMAVLVLGYMFRAQVVAAFDSPLWRIMVN